VKKFTREQSILLEQISRLEEESKFHEAQTIQLKLIQEVHMRTTASLHQEIANLKSANDFKELELIARLEQNLFDEQQNLRAERRKSLSFERAREDFEKKYLKAQLEIASLQTEVQLATSNFDECSSRLKQCEERFALREKELAAVKFELKGLSQQIVDANATFAVETVRLKASSDHEIAELSTRLQTAESKLDEANAALSVLEARVAQVCYLGHCFLVVAHLISIYRTR
jgi:chromosome segregation ATPase